jgi:MFS family permease
VAAVVHVPRPARLHYRWVILAVTSLTVLMAAGVTAVPAVLIHPLEVEFGWDRATIALAVSINVLLYGLAGPFAGGLMLRFGPRRVMLTSLVLIACGVAATTQVRSLLQLYLLWGVVVGLGTGSTALVLSATVVNRWFTTPVGWHSACSAPPRLRVGSSFCRCSPPSWSPWAGRLWGGSSLGASPCSCYPWWRCSCATRRRRWG